MDKKRKTFNEGDPCKKCGSPISFRERKDKGRFKQKKYYYSHFFYCYQCRSIYFDDRFKVIIDRSKVKQQDLFSAPKKKIKPFKDQKGMQDFVSLALNNKKLS